MSHVINDQSSKRQINRWWQNPRFARFPSPLKSRLRSAPALLPISAATVWQTPNVPTAWFLGNFKRRHHTHWCQHAAIPGFGCHQCHHRDQSRVPSWRRCFLCCARSTLLSSEHVYCFISFRFFNIWLVIYVCYV